MSETRTLHPYSQHVIDFCKSAVDIFDDSNDLADFQRGPGHFDWVKRTEMKKVVLTALRILPDIIRQSVPYIEYNYVAEQLSAIHSKTPKRDRKDLDEILSLCVKVLTRKEW